MKSYDNQLCRHGRYSILMGTTTYILHASCCTAFKEEVAGGSGPSICQRRGPFDDGVVCSRVAMAYLRHEDEGGTTHPRKKATLSFVTYSRIGRAPLSRTLSYGPAEADAESRGTSPARR